MLGTSLERGGRRAASTSESGFQGEATRLKVVVLGAALAASLLAPSPCAAKQSFHASIWVIEAGAQSLQWFGHILLCFDDTGRHISNADCYNFGALASSQEHFLADFVGGRAEYRTEVLPAVRVSARYRNERRAIKRLPIHATPAEVQRLRDLVDARFPAGRPYPYRAFRENCTTRLVSALRLGLGPRWSSNLGHDIDVAGTRRAQLDNALDRGPAQRAALVLVTDSVLGSLDAAEADSAVFLPAQFTGPTASAWIAHTTLWRLGFIGVMVGGVALGRRAGRTCIAVLLGAFALVTWIARWRAGMPEMSANWAWLLYCPLDFCLLSDKLWVRRYVVARVVGVVSMVAAAFGGLIGQSILWPALAVVGGLCTAAYLSAFGRWRGGHRA